MEYKPPALLVNGHLETIYPALFRKVRTADPTKERIRTPDQDFLDLFWHHAQSERLVIISHGLEGNADRAYMKGMAKACTEAGFDALTWNYRGCGTEMNQLLRFYHSGATDDLHEVIQHAVARGYQQIFLVGFSLGGNMTLKYLGEGQADALPVVAGVAISVPLDLSGSCLKLSLPANAVYSRRFLKSLKEKIVRKSKLLPGLDISRLDKIRTLIDFDDAYTAPLHGFLHAQDYYSRCSASGFLQRLKVPTLIINARNDPFLSEACYPAASVSRQLTTLYPRRGGHVGFTQFGKNGLYWSEEQAVRFLLQHTDNKQPAPRQNPGYD